MAISVGMLKTGTKWLNQSSAGVTLAATAASSLGDFAYYTVPKGVGLIIPGSFILILELKDAGAAELPGTAELYFGIRVPTEPRRTIPIGGAMPYQPWHDLTLSQQRNTDNQAAIMINMGIPFLPLVQDEILALQVYNTSTAAVATASTIFYIPYQERGVTELTRELGLRKSWIQV